MWRAGAVMPPGVHTPRSSQIGSDPRARCVLHRGGLQFEYDVVRLWRKPVQPFLEGGVGLLPLAPLCKMPAGKPLAEALREVVREIDRRLAREADRPKAVRLMTAAFILTGL